MSSTNLEPQLSSTSDDSADSTNDVEAPNWMAIYLTLGALGVAVAFMIYFGDWTNAAIFGGIFGGSASSARRQLLVARGDETAAQRWNYVSFAFYVPALAYALYLVGQRLL